MGSAQDALNKIHLMDAEFHGTKIDGMDHISGDVVLRAKLISSHFLLPDNATIIDMGCGDGHLTAAIAHFCPRHRFIGLDRNTQTIERATKKYDDVENLKFQKATTGSLPFDDSSVDGIINSRILGDIYSGSGYREGAVRQALQEQFRVLRTEGMMVIYDYARAPDDEYMLIEFPTLQKSASGQPQAAQYKKTSGDRDAEDLLWFSEHARPKQARGCEGFFLEELAPRLPYTRLFRLPAKWAFEFIIRKENKTEISKDISREHAVFSGMDYDRELQSLGGRVLYSTPWQNPHILQTRFKDSFRLYHDNGVNAGYPATGKLITIQKMQNRKSLLLHELRSTKNEAQSLAIQTVRDEKTGQLIDVVERKEPTVDLIPYTITEDNRLKVYLHFAAPKCVANTVPRVGNNLDGKKWSGHIVSSLKMPLEQLQDVQNGKPADMARMMMKQTGLKPSVMAKLEEGPQGYQSPDMIAELSQTFFVEVQDGQSPKCVAKLFEDRKGFSTVGEIRELDVHDVLRAINVGFIPNGWLEIQLHDLLARHDEAPQKWMHQALPVAQELPPADRIIRVADILSQIEASMPQEKSDTDEDDDIDEGTASGDAAGSGGQTKIEKWVEGERFKRVKGSAGKMRTVRSLFIDEGMVDGKLEGLASSDAEFAIMEGETVNKAVIMPLTSDYSGNILMGFELEQLPVPSRMGQGQKMLNLPSLTLPRDVTSIDEAKAHIADLFETTPDRVTQMGESFFTNVDVTPQRIFYFAVGSAAGGGNPETFYAPITDLWMLLKPDYAWSVLYVWGFANLMLCGDHDTFSADFTPRNEAKQRMTGNNAPRHSSTFSLSAEKGSPSSSETALMGGNLPSRKIMETTKIPTPANKDSKKQSAPSSLDKPQTYNKS